MLRTSKMKLVELMILKQDIDRVLEYLGKNDNFQIQRDTDFSGTAQDTPYTDMVSRLQGIRVYLGIPDPVDFLESTTLPDDEDFASARSILESVEELRKQEMEAGDRKKRIVNAYDEAMSFANLKLAYS